MLKQHVKGAQMPRWMFNTSQFLWLQTLQEKG